MEVEEFDRGTKVIPIPVLSSFVAILRDAAMKIMNSTDARTHPCLTSLFTAKGSERSPPTYTLAMAPSCNCLIIPRKMLGHHCLDSIVPIGFSVDLVKRFREVDGSHILVLVLLFALLFCDLIGSSIGFLGGFLHQQNI